MTTTIKDQPTNGHLAPADARAILEQAAKVQEMEIQERLKKYGA